MSILDFLYHTIPGRMGLKILTNPAIAKLCGCFLDSRASKFLIDPFVRANAIDLSQFYSNDFRSFNDCFARKIRKGMRPFDPDPSSFVAPCDGLLSVCEIKNDTVIPVKQTAYNLTRLLHSKKLAKRYEGGYCLVYRLCVNHYHRYSYIDSGVKGPNHFINGKLHTVQPIALENVPVFTENCREFTVMNTDNFGKVVQMEVGAMLVGKIKNYHGRHVIKRGEEKGCFLYGGSTIIILTEPGRVVIDENILRASARGEETRVLMGEYVGKGVKKNRPF